MKASKQQIIEGMDLWKKMATLHEVDYHLKKASELLKDVELDLPALLISRINEKLDGGHYQ